MAQRTRRTGRASLSANGGYADGAAGSAFLAKVQRGEGEKWPFLAAVGLPIRDRTDANFVATFADRLFHEDNLRLSPRTRQSLRAKLTFRRAHAA
jgi:hypothetical protein